MRSPLRRAVARSQRRLPALTPTSRPSGAVTMHGRAPSHSPTGPHWPRRRTSPSRTAWPRSTTGKWWRLPPRRGMTNRRLSRWSWRTPATAAVFSTSARPMRGRTPMTAPPPWPSSRPDWPTRSSSPGRRRTSWVWVEAWGALRNLRRVAGAWPAGRRRPVGPRHRPRFRRAGPAAGDHRELPAGHRHRPHSRSARPECARHPARARQAPVTHDDGERWLAVTMGHPQLQPVVPKLARDRVGRLLHHRRQRLHPRRRNVRSRRGEADGGHDAAASVPDRSRNAPDPALVLLEVHRGADLPVPFHPSNERANLRRCHVLIGVVAAEEGLPELR